MSEPLLPNNFDASDSNATIRRQIRTPQIVWSFFLFSTFTYLYVTRLRAGGTISLSLEHFRADNLFLMAIGVVSIVFLGLATIVPKIIRSRLIRSKPLDFKTWFQIFILRIATIESICILGMICAIQSKDVSVGIPFFIATWLGLLLTFPSINSYRDFTSAT